MRENPVVITDQNVFRTPDTAEVGTVVRMGNPDGMLPNGYMRLTEPIDLTRVDHQFVKSDSCTQPEGPTVAFAATGLFLYERDGAYSVDPEFRMGDWGAKPALTVWAECGCARAFVGESGVDPVWFRELVWNEMPLRYMLSSRLQLPREHQIRLLIIGDGTIWTDRLKRYIAGLDPEDNRFDCVQVPDIDAALAQVNWADVAIVADAVYDHPHGEATEQTALDLIELLEMGGVPTIGWHPSPSDDDTFEDQSDRIMAAGARTFWFGPRFFGLVKRVVDLAGVPAVASATVSKE